MITVAIYNWVIWKLIVLPFCGLNENQEYRKKLNTDRHDTEHGNWNKLGFLGRPS